MTPAIADLRPPTTAPPATRSRWRWRRRDGRDVLGAVQLRGRTEGESESESDEADHRGWLPCKELCQSLPWRRRGDRRSSGREGHAEPTRQGDALSGAARDSRHLRDPQRLGWRLGERHGGARIRGAPDPPRRGRRAAGGSEEDTTEIPSQSKIVCRLLL